MRAIAAQLASFDALPAVLDLIEVGDALGRNFETVAQAYFALDGCLQFPWLRTKVASLPSASHWQALAKAALREDLAGMQRQLTADALRAAGTGETPQALQAWEEGNHALIERFRQVQTDLRAHKTLDLAMLSVALKELRNIAAPVQG